jgi:hypothetical protein
MTSVLGKHKFFEAFYLVQGGRKSLVALKEAQALLDFLVRVITG